MNLFQAIFNQDSLQRTAILYEQQRISYAYLRQLTLAVAGALRALEIRSGDRVALLLNDSPEFIASFIAVCSYGAIAVPINTGLGLDQQRAILNDCAASVALAEIEISAALLSYPEIMLPHVKELVVVTRQQVHEELATGYPGNLRKGKPENKALKIWSLGEVMCEARSRSHGDFLETPFADLRDNQPAFILYTSGSTGEPKGAVHSQANIFYTNETYGREVLRLRAGDRLFSSSRLPFAYGLGNAFTFPLLNGCTTILCREKPSPEVIARVFAEYQPTIFFAVPVVYRLLLDQSTKHERGNLSPSSSGRGPSGHVLASSSAPSPGPSPGEGNKDPRLDCSSLRLCVSAGEALPAQLGEEWETAFGVPVLDGIGSTEMLHMWMSNHEGENVYGSSGKLLTGYEARLLDPEGQPAPTGAEGNLWVRGASAAIGYWERPETTASTFVDGWVRTGDIYRQDADGFWFHMGRSDDCFKSSGQWVSPVEVEGVLLRHEGINRVAVVEDFDAVGLPCACAFVVVKEAEPGRADSISNEPGLEDGLRKLTSEHLPRFKQPRRYVFIDELPYTATGKIQRFKLREQLRAKRRGGER